MFQNDSLVIQAIGIAPSAEVLLDICDPPEFGYVLVHSPSRISYVPTIASGMDEFIMREVVMRAQDTQIREIHHAIQIFEDSISQCVDKLLVANDTSIRSLYASPYGLGKLYFVPGKKLCRGFIHSFRITKQPRFGQADIIPDELHDSLLLYTRVVVPGAGAVDTVHSEYCVDKHGEIICKDFVHLVEYIR